MFAGPRPKAVGSEKKASLPAAVQCCQQLTCFPDAFLISLSISVSFATTVNVVAAWLLTAWLILLSRA